MTEFTLAHINPPRLPDDPLHYVLSEQTGWRHALLENVEQSADGDLQLSPKPGTGRPVVDAAGSFGGLALPTGVAQDGRGIYLLDATAGIMKLFDPCECKFEKVPCTGGLGAAPRQLNDPHGIAIWQGNLYVCDTGNRRVQVFAIKGINLRAIWLSPLSANLPEPWQPFDIAFDAHGRAFVSDRVNGVVHRFSRQGRWEMKFGALNQPTHVAIDKYDHVYVVEAGSDDVLIFDAGGNFLANSNRPDQLARKFRPAPFQTDRQGNLYLGDMCTGKAEPIEKCAPSLQPKSSAAVFDLRGNRIDLTPDRLKQLQFQSVAFNTDGTYLSQSLDSEIYRCQWHRLLLKGQIPQGASLKVETLTTETTLDDADLSNLPESQWRTQQIANATTNGAWDCLITSPPGRFLYLRLTFRGNGATTPRLARANVFFPRVSLRRYLPAVFGENPVSADFADRLLAIFDTIYRSVEEKVDNFAVYLDPLATPSERDPKTLLDFLTWLGSWLGLVLERSWSEKRRRRLLADAHCLHRLRGTPAGLRRLLLLYLGWEPPEHHKQRCRCATGAATPSALSPRACRRCSYQWQPPPLVLEHFKLRRWLFLGEGRLGEQSILWGKRIVNRSQLNENAEVGATQLKDTGDPVRDPFHFYAHKFSVFVPAACARSDANRAALEHLVSLGTPAHAVAELKLVEPRFRIGFQSSIGFDSVVARYPENFSMREHRLGYDTVIGKDPSEAGGPSLEIGEQSRIGTTTILE